jgi:Fe-S-cluster-containing hydrogenase component 2
VGAIEAGDEAYRVVREKCIGCGLCVATCPAEAIRLTHKPQTEVVTPPANEADWYEQRARGRGVDYSPFK